MRAKYVIAMLLFSVAAVSMASFASEAEAQRRQVPQQYHAVPRQYYFPPIDRVLGFYYHPYFGFYFGPYYGPFYPYPGPYVGPSRFSTTAVRTKVKPVETEVYVNGYYAGIVDDFDGVFQRLYLPAGEHEIELRLDGHRSYRKKLYLSPSDTLDINHTMEPVAAGETSEPPPEPRELHKPSIGNGSEGRAAHSQPRPARIATWHSGDSCPTWRCADSYRRRALVCGGRTP